MSTWTFLRFDRAKGHYVSAALRDLLLREAVERNFELYDAKPISKGGMDLPGMMSVNRGYEYIPLPGGLTFSIPYTDFAYFKNELEGLELRQFSNGEPYFKLHGWLSCLVLTPQERTEMLQYMRENLARVEAQGRAEADALTKAIEEMNKDQVRVIRPSVNKPIAAGTPLSGMPNKEKN